MSEWPRHRLADLTTKVGSGATPKGGGESYKSVGTPLIRSMNVVFFGFKRHGLAYLDDKQAAQLAGVTVQPGDVLLNITGASIGRVSIAPADLAGARVNQHVCIIRPNEAIQSRFLAAYLSAPQIQDLIASDNFGVTRQALTKQQILDFTVPVPPREEQTRIADQLDILLARIQGCNDHLDAIPALLKRFRQAVLEAACSGTLTEDWRAASGNKQPWPTLRLANVISEMRNGLSAKPTDAPPGTKILRISAVRPGVLDTSDHRYLDVIDAVAASASLVRGDVLFTRYNGTREFVGACALVRQDMPEFVYPDKLIRVRVRPELVLPEFFALACNCSDTRSQVEAFIKSSAGQKGISGGDLKSIKLRVPELKEQAEVVLRVEAIVKLADRIEARFTAARAQAQRLTPLLLAKAFRGELVPQDPNDEPARVLLARIAAQRGQTAIPTKTRQPRKPRAAHAPQETTAMTKSRHDDDVMGHAYLASHLRRLGAPTTAEALFKVAELPVADFYKQLAWEVAKGHVKDGQTLLEARSAA